MQHSTYRRPETCNQDAPGAACSVLTLLADINTGEPESSEWDLVLLPDFSLTVSVSHSVHSVGASNCSLGSTGQKKPIQQTNSTCAVVLHCGLHCAHTHTLQAAHSPVNAHLSTLPLRCVAVAAAAPAPAPASALLLCLHLHCTYLPAPAPNFSRLFLDCVPPFPTWLPKSTFTLSRRLHYQMVRFLLSPPSLFSCRDVDEEEDWPPDTDRTLTPAPATTQTQSPERNRRPRVPLR